MATQLIQLRSVQEVMNDYVPLYNPISGLFLGKSQQYSDTVGQVDFKRIATVGDVRAKHITPKDTEIRQLAVSDGLKSFKKYFLANQFIQSALQDNVSAEEVVKQVLDEHQKQWDELLLYGDGTAPGNVVNNGLFYSSDANYKLNSSAAVTAGSDQLNDFHAKIVALAATADQVSGRKLIMFYGAIATAKFDAVYTSIGVPFKRLLADVLQGYATAKLPSQVQPASGDGVIIVNLDQVKMHYTAQPKLQAQGVNEEKLYSWYNFLMGSCMLEVLTPNAVIRQPLTFP